MFIFVLDSSGLIDLDCTILEVGPNALQLLRQVGMVHRTPYPAEPVEAFVCCKLAARVQINSFC